MFRSAAEDDPPVANPGRPRPVTVRALHGLARAPLSVSVMPTITALSFDADQTLWDFQAVKRVALEATIAEMERRCDLPVGVVTPEAMDQARNLMVERFRGAVHRLEEVRERSFAEVLSDHDHPTPDAAAATLVEHYMHVRFNQIELFSDVPDALTLLKRHYRLGLLSNGNTYPDRCGLPDTFDAVVLGPEHGFEKPDRRAFATVAYQLGVDVTQLAHTGDDWDDIEGANASGAVSIYLNRAQENPRFRADADHEVRDLFDLVTLLERLHDQAVSGG